VAKFDAYPMPRVEKMFESIGCSAVISTLDLAKGYIGRFHCLLILEREQLLLPLLDYMSSMLCHLASIMHPQPSNK